MTAKKHSPLSFEAALTELESVVARLEQGELSLEETLQRFEQGVALTRTCQIALQLAEQKVEQLLEKNGDLDILPFDETTA
ncbi:exodeoxyribonuclease VII small subunit [Candidatus Competibacter phosphatis]|jgi:exodeoxyribonuclease VII small subunit|uniref:Exodeoxyribonuclease 7 small subunit n=1 Tax=Candidatus Competibacter phosphatis TaxID=221280 RepID=A0ABX1THQ4_9GAMM|nr:exodeoxyribonuclease VII small subunit [Candidatus Competibacter phosphatis]MCP5450314.1 exodeoxyribonuclease VII small subunit [Gammaproteobacteria bacterium]MDG4561641.1 exodeoxyribonuclease VII small subunit [Candidatus Competibacter sp.]NMQ18908.1 exodeoxyribonuclease VII small subunit [Candidatus Competibacter phosphatis]